MQVATECQRLCVLRRMVRNAPWANCRALSEQKKLCQPFFPWHPAVMITRNDDPANLPMPRAAGIERLRSRLRASGGRMKNIPEHDQRLSLRAENQLVQTMQRVLIRARRKSDPSTMKRGCFTQMKIRNINRLGRSIIYRMSRQEVQAMLVEQEFHRK